MALEKETIVFLIFCMLGIIFSVVYDVFRAIRKLRTPKKFEMYLQDIIYLVIIGTVLIIVIVNFEQNTIRLYNFLGLILGILFYISIFENKIRNIFVHIFKLNSKIIELAFLPVLVFSNLIVNFWKKNKNFVYKCCKKNVYMVNFKKKVLNSLKKTKEVLNEKRRKFRKYENKQE